MTAVPLDMDAEHAAFEKWYLTTQTMSTRGRVARYDGAGAYRDGLVRVAWRAWVQSAERSAARVNAPDAKSPIS